MLNSQNTYMTINQVADYLSVSVATINRWRRGGGFPKARQFSAGCVRWRRADIFDWEESRATCFSMSFDSSAVECRALEDVS